MVEGVLEISHDVACDANSGAFPALTGEIEHNQRKIRVELFKYVQVTKVALGVVKGKFDAKLKLDKNDHCSAEKIETKLVTTPVNEDKNKVQTILARYSPFMVIRKDQKEKRFTDVAIAGGYSKHPLPDDRTEYCFVIYFTDEDSRPGVASTKMAQGRFGRIGDTEMIYKVSVDNKTGDKVSNSEKFQTGKWGGPFGHNPDEPFKGEYLTDSEHPILYDFTPNNIFTQKRPEGVETIGYHLVWDAEKSEIQKNEARDALARRSFPWIYELSDLEAKAEKKLAVPFTDYLHVEVTGTGGGFRADITLDGTTYYAGVGALAGEQRPPNYFNDLEDDVWSKARVTTIPVGAEKIKRVGTQAVKGSVILTKANAGEAFAVEQVKIYRVKIDPKSGKISFEDLAAHLKCDLPKEGVAIPPKTASATVCEF